MGYSSVVEPVTEALSSVSAPERELLALLYGFDGRRWRPEEIARQRGLSLRQIDQTVKGVIRRMRHPACASLIRNALVSADERIWSALAGATGILYKTESMPKAGERLPGDLLCAIDCQYGSLDGWLSANTRSVAGAGYRSRIYDA